MAGLIRRVTKTFFAMIALLLLAIVTFWIYLCTRPAGKTIRPVAIISLPAPFRLNRPFVDYIAISGQMLYAGYTSQGVVSVMDTVRNQVVATIGGLRRVHGVAIDAKRNLGFVTDGEANSVGMFDLSLHRVLERTDVWGGPDAIIFDRKSDLVYVGSHEGMIGTLIDPSTRKVIATINLGGKPEYAQADPETGAIYQNLQDTGEVVVVDPQKKMVTSRFKLPCQSPTGLAMDNANRRLFVACLDRQLVVVDADIGRIVRVLPIGFGADGVAYDAGLRRVYVSNGLGTLTVIQQETSDVYHRLEDAPTHLGGHTVVIDPVTHRIYVAYFGSIAIYDAIN